MDTANQQAPSSKGEPRVGVLQGKAVALGSPVEDP